MTEDRASRALNRSTGEHTAGQMFPQQDDTSPLLDTIRRGLEQAPEYAGEALGAAAEYVTDVVSGEKRREFHDIPELGTSGPSVSPFSEEGMTMGAAYGVSVEPEQIADIAMKTLPGARRRDDKFGNPIINFEGQDYYINRPGISEADFYQFLAQTGLYAPASRAGLATRGLSRRAWRVGSRSGLTSLSNDWAAQALGAEEGASIARAGTAGLVGGMAEIANPLAKTFWRWMFKRNDMIDMTTGELTRKGRAAAEAADLDPDNMTASLKRAFAGEAQDEPIPSVAKAKALTKTEGIPFTAGEQTQNIDQMAFEEAMRHGTKGPQNQEIIANFNRQRQEAFEEAAERAQARLGGAGIDRPAKGGEILNEALESRVADLDAQIDTAYQIARNYQTSLDDPGEGFSRLVKSVYGELKDFELDPELFPAATKSIKLIKNFIPDVEDVGPVQPVSIMKIENLRRKIGNNIGASKSKADRQATSIIKRTLDQWIDDAVDENLFKGDVEGVAKLLEARGLRRTRGKLFEANKTLRDPDAAGEVIQKLVERNPTPEQTVNWIFGASRLGNKELSTKVAQRLNQIFPENSPEWNTLREIGWMRLTRNKDGNLVSAAQMEKNLNEVLYSNRSLMETLYNKEEIALLGELSEALKLTRKPREALNPSSSGYTIMKAMRDLIRRSGTGVTLGGGHYRGGLLFTAGRFWPTEELTRLGRSGPARRAVRGVPDYGTRATGPTAPLVAGEQLRPGDEQ